MLVSISEAALLIGVAVSTLRRWESEGRFLADSRTKGGHRRYCTARIAAEFFGLRETPQNRETIAYARVSSHDQKQDLERQKAALAAFCREQDFERVSIIADLGSGLNYRKRGLKALIQKICAGKVARLVLTHRDRLLRFGSELIFSLCAQFGTEVIVLGASGTKSFNEELCADVIELMTVFTARMYGKRSHQHTKRAA